MCPYQRLAPCLTTDRPWLGVGMVRQPLPYDSFLRYTPVVYPGASPRSTPEPEPDSRHLYAGHHLGSRQVLPQTDPEVTTRLGFDAVDTLSTRHQWFTRVRLPGSYLTHYSCALSVTLTTSALDRRSVRWFEASACTAAPEGPPPSLMQPASVRFDLLHRSLLQPSWRTVVRAADRPPARAAPRGSCTGGRGPRTDRRSRAVHLLRPGG